MNKKGWETMPEWMVYSIFLFIVILVLLSAVVKIKDKRLHNLRIEARDYAFTRDAASVTPYEINYVYYSKKNDIEIKFNPENCLVQAKYKDDRTLPIPYFCGVDKDKDDAQIKLEVKEKKA